MTLAWGAKVSPEFCRRVIAIAGRLGFDPDWLMACMAFETGGTFSPSVRNPASSATGLIQFMDATARGLGTSTALLAAMSAEEQLEWVERYFKGFDGRIASLSACYMAILWPKAIGQPDSAVIFLPGSQAYLVNRGLDLNHDGAVTKAEAAAPVARKLVEGLLPFNVAHFDQNTQPAAPIEERDLSNVPPAQPSEPAQPFEPAQPTKGAQHMGLLAILGPIISSLIPQVAKLFDQTSEVAQRNQGAAQLVLDTIVKTTGAINEQQAIENIQSDPALLKAATEAVLTEPTILQLLEVGGGIQLAREASIVMQTAEKPFWYNPTFWATLLVLPLVYWVVGSVLLGGPDSKYWGASFQPETRSAVVNLVIGMVLGGVMGMWFGTNFGSKSKDSTIAALANTKG